MELSPDSVYVAYSLQSQSYGYIQTVSGTPPSVIGSDVWIANVATGRARNLTAGRGSSWAPSWSPNGRKLAFFSDRGGRVCLWVWDRISGSFHRVSTTPLSIRNSFENPDWTPDGAAVLVVASTIATETGEEHREKSPAVYFSTGSPSALPQQSFPPMHTEDLAMINVKSGVVRHVARGVPPLWYRLSPDGREIAFTVSVDQFTQDGSTATVDLFVVDLSVGRSRPVARGIRTFNGVNFTWSPDGKWIAYTTAQFGVDGGLVGKVFVVSLPDGEQYDLTPPKANLISQFGIPLWDAKGTRLYVLSLSGRPTGYIYDGLWSLSQVTTRQEKIISLPQSNLIAIVGSPTTGRVWSPDDGRSIIVMTHDQNSLKDGFSLVDLISGRTTALFDENRSYGVNGLAWSMDVSTDSKCAVYRVQAVAEPENISLLCAGHLSSPLRVTSVAPQFDGVTMGASRLIEWMTEDGSHLRGALLLPAGYEQGKRYPLIVYQYPGVYESMFLNDFGMSDNPIDNMQLFATRGYAVLLPDEPVAVGTPMRDIMRAVDSGVNKVIDMGIADPDRLGIMGHSWGGYGVLSIISQTTRFKAAVSRSGVGGDLISYYTSMQADGSAGGLAETESLRTGGSLWQDRDVFLTNSPVFRFDSVSTPLLLTHGTMDPVSATLSDEVFVSLRRLRKSVEYAKYEERSHYEWEWSYRDRLDFLARLCSWFDSHLKGPQ